MADIIIGPSQGFGIHSIEDGLTVIRELDEEFIKLGKRIHKRIKTLQTSLKNLLKGYGEKITSMLDDVFRVDSMEAYSRGVSLYGKELADALYQIQLSFSGLKLAIIQAALPIVQVLLPVVQAAISVLTGLANSIGKVLRVLLLGSEDAQNFGTSLNGAASAGTKLKKTLAGFDQINRLNDAVGSYGGISIPNLKPISGNWSKFADKILELLEPLRKLDFSAAAQSLERLKAALEPITKALFDGLEWAWYNIFIPLAQWASEELLPVFLDTLTDALKALAQVIEDLKPSFMWLWENYLKPLAQWKGDQMIAYLQGLSQEFAGMNSVLMDSQNPIGSFLLSGKSFIHAIAEMARKTMGLSAVTQSAKDNFTHFLNTAILSRGHLSGTTSSVGVLAGVIAEVGTAFGIMENSSNAAWESMKGIWDNAWGHLKDNLTDPAAEEMKGLANGMIGVVNSMLQGINAGLNAMGKAINKINITIPDWVPLIGGKSIGFSIPALVSPTIPFLAKGAVLPANRPFMAVVGDQRHGTNIEAPLTTIQEAMALVMEEYTSANMAGHDATVQVLRELLAAVLGIRIGDEAIAGAVDRYNRKMAVVRGGYL